MSLHKEYRNPPPQDFKKYTFTKFFSDLESENTYHERFVKIQIQDSEISEDIYLGFDFKFNQKIYDRVKVSTKGFFILREKNDTGGFNPLSFFEAELSSEEWSRPNLLIKDEFEAPGVLLCPWFGNLFSTNVAGSSVNTEGKEPPSSDVHHFDNGVNFIKLKEKNGVKSFVLKWRVYSGETLLEDEDKIVLRFEACLKEDGKIEFKYLPVRKINNPFVHPGLAGASIGIFVNDDGWNFRDLSDDIGYLNEGREKNQYGGYSLTDYLDNAVNVSNEIIDQKPYSVSLLPIKGSTGITIPPSLRGKPANWPGGEKSSCIFYFTPPKRRRIVLPKREIKNRSNLVTNPQVLKSIFTKKKNSRVFDDRLAIDTINIQNLNMPIGLTRFFGNGLEGVESRQDLFSDTEVSLKINQTNIDQYIYEKNVQYSEPFKDDHLNEQKDFQFELELPIVHELEITHTCSSIYYYNKKSSGFFMPYPQGLINPVSEFLTSVTEKQTNDWSGFGPTGMPFVSSSTNGAPELSILTPENSQNEPWKAQNRDQFLKKWYGTSFQNSSNRAPNEDEVFELPIGIPFALERMEIEFPFEADSSWFDDKTVTSTVIGEFSEDEKIKGYSNKILDFAGPALTFALFHKSEAQLSEDNPALGQKNLNLVARGTLTHQGDVDSSISTRITWTQTLKSSDLPQDDLERVWIFEPEGFKSFFGEPDTSIEPNQEDGSFSGKARLSLQSKVSNGAVASFFMTIPKIYSNSFPNITPENRKVAVKNFLSSKKFKFTKPNDESSNPTLNFDIQNTLKTVDPFGVSKDGSDVSSRVLGPKVASISNDLHGIYFDYVINSIPDSDNPFYISDNFEDFPQPIQDIINNEQNLNAIFHATIPILGEEKTSYLIMPGDKLSLALSKFRPALSSKSLFLNSDFPNFRHGNEHGLKIKPGSVKIKFFGKVLRAFDEINLDQKQQFDTFSISEPISSGPIVDQFELFPVEQFAGSYTDDFVFGNLKNSFGKKISWVEKPYGIRLFSKTFRENVTSNDYTICKFFYTIDKFSNFLFGRPYNSLNHDDSILLESCEDHLYRPSSRSERLRPISDFCGTQRIVRLCDENERFYDSMMPSLQECFEIDQTTPFVFGDLNDPDFFNPTIPGENIFIEPTSSIGGYSSSNINQNSLWDRYASLVFNSPKSLLGNEESVQDFCVNNSWSYSFPFEEKYQNIKRTINFEKFSETNVLLRKVFKEVNVVTQGRPDNSPEKIDHFIPCRALKDQDEIIVNFLIDANMLKNYESNFSDIQFFEKIGLSGSDLYKVMFGFGDENTVFLEENQLCGHNRQPKFRQTFEITDSSLSSSKRRTFSISPAIRGWKFGVLSGLPLNSSMVFRRGSFGQFRDMLEQRFYTKSLLLNSERFGLDPGPVSVKFVDYAEKSVDPLKTFSQNITADSSCGFPYIDGIAKNRPEVDPTILGRTYIPIDI